MARRFAKVVEEEIEEAFFYPSDLVNTKTTIPLRVGEERWIYTYPSGDGCIIFIVHLTVTEERSKCRPFPLIFIVNF